MTATGGGKMKRVSMCFAVLVVAELCALTGAGLAAQIRLSNDIAWVSSSDAYKCCVQQAYTDAGRRVRDLSRGEKPGTWCVVFDADETIISNVEFQTSLQARGVGYSGKAWDEWCNKGRATALPGAREFCAAVRECGGKVVIITNREEDVRKATLKNLDELGFTYDACIFREGPYRADRSKAVRRADVEGGALKTLPAGKRLPALKILMLVGDQTPDLYNDKEIGFKDVKERFGRDLVIMPNPMYGDWEKGGTFVEAVGEASGAPTGKRAVVHSTSP
jgi:5'-nucleotidase (lipoprotein e(P4) family)